LSSHFKINKRKFSKWRGVCKAYKNPILKSNVGQTSSENKKKTCKAQVVSTTILKWYGVKCGLGIFKEGTIIDDDLHKERCSQLLTQMSGCNILLSCNLWFKVEEIKTKQGFL
jgi:hypothetical protein